MHPIIWDETNKQTKNLSIKQYINSKNSKVQMLQNYLETKLHWLIQKEKENPLSLKNKTENP